jgi:hypothetical protein
MAALIARTRMPRYELMSDLFSGPCQLPSSASRSPPRRGGDTIWMRFSRGWAGISPGKIADAGCGPSALPSVFRRQGGYIREAAEFAFRRAGRAEKLMDDDAFADRLHRHKGRLGRWWTVEMLLLFALGRRTFSLRGRGAEKGLCRGLTDGRRIERTV